MQPLQALLLGAVQGLTEVLPISSSAHLILVPYLLNWPPFEQKLAFDIALHVGTLLALLIYFWRDWLQLAQSAVRLIRAPIQPFSPSTRLLLMLVVGSVPAAIAGFLFEDVVETRLRSPLVAAVTLIAFALLLALAERIGQRRRSLNDLHWWDAVGIGLAQSLALIPGVSRSGITITAGLFSGLERATAARFSFLLATPIIFGAGVVKGPDLFSGGLAAQEFIDVGVGITAATIVGFASIHLLMRYVQYRSYAVFVFYRLLLGGLVLLLTIAE